jgi:4-amino-4-deoxy-L-arabinose transferase-like glycosyltransferase
LLCSLGEIATTAIIVRLAWGERAALYAATLLSFMPLHIELATNIHADPMLAFAMTLTFALFWQGEISKNPQLYFAAGVSAGFAYWVKEVSVLFLFTFLVYSVVERRWQWSWAYAGTGALLLFGLNCALMWGLSGDPFHVVKVAHSMVNSAWTDNAVVDAPLFYFRYLFFDIRHTWLVAYLALASGVYLLVRQKTIWIYQRQFGAYVAIWLLGLLAVFSFIPVSFAPLRLVMKQSNYLSLFLAPLAIMGSLGLSRLGQWERALVMAVFVVGGVTLAGLAQQDGRAFLGNGQAAEAFAKAHADDVVYGTAWVWRVSLFHARLRSLTAEPRIRDIRDLHPMPDMPPGRKLVVVIDHETFGRSSVDVKLPHIPSCWVRTGKLAPIGYGAGAVVTKGVIWIARLLPGSFGDRISRSVERLLHPAAAEVYAVPLADPWCGTPPPV